MRIKINQNGYTIIELLISMAAFSAMVLVAGLTILQIGKMYYKGINTINTQETARNALASVSQSAQLDAGTPKSGSASFGNPATPNTFVVVQSRCIGNTRFSFVKNLRVTDGVSIDKGQRQIRHALWQDSTNDSSCPAADLTNDDPSLSGGVSGSGRELLGANMRLRDFDVALSSNGAIGIKIGVIYGDNDLVEETSPDEAVGCLGGVVGSQWCASSYLTTQVMKRTSKVQ